MEATTETQRVIANIVEHFTNTVNDPNFLKDMEQERWRNYLVKQIESSLKMVATQKAIEIKNSISTINI